MFVFLAPRLKGTYFASYILTTYTRTVCLDQEETAREVMRDDDGEMREMIDGGTTIPTCNAFLICLVDGTVISN